MLRHKRIPLTTGWAITHYGIPLALTNFPLIYWPFQIFRQNPAVPEDSLYVQFGFGVFPLLLAALLAWLQYRKLFFTPVRTPLPPAALNKAFERLCRDCGWTPDHIGKDCFVAHTPDRTFSWGEQLFVVFGRGEVWINSVNNMDDRAAVSSFGCVRRNKLLLQKTIEQAGPGDD